MADWSQTGPVGCCSNVGWCQLISATLPSPPCPVNRVNTKVTVLYLQNDPCFWPQSSASAVCGADTVLKRLTSGGVCRVKSLRLIMKIVACLLQYVWVHSTLLYWGPGSDHAWVDSTSHAYLWVPLESMFTGHQSSPFNQIINVGQLLLQLLTLTGQLTMEQRP